MPPPRITITDDAGYTIAGAAAAADTSVAEMFQET